MNTKMPGPVFVNQPLKVSRVKLVIDLVGIIFWTALMFSLCIGVLMDQSVPKAALLVGFIPILFLFLALKDLFSHLRAKTIVLQEEGIEILKRDDKSLVAWKTIVRLSERRRYSGGLSLYCESGKIVCVPFVVQEYDAIKNYIITKIASKNAQTQP